MYLPEGNCCLSHLVNPPFSNMPLSLLFSSFYNFPGPIAIGAENFKM